MKNLGMLVWLTQLGLSVALPPAGFILLGVYLRDRWGIGNWIVWVAVVLGIICAIEGLRSSLKAMRLMSEDKKESPIAYNDHD